MGEATKEQIEDARMDGVGGCTEYTASEVLNRTQRSQKAEVESGHGPEELPCSSRVSRADHPGHDSVVLWVSARMEASQPLQATCSSVLLSPLKKKMYIYSLMFKQNFPYFNLCHNFGHSLWAILLISGILN